MKHSKPYNNPIGISGFTLVEVLLATIVLGLVAMAISSVYVTGVRVSESQGEFLMLDAALRSEMESLISLSFADLEDGSATYDIGGKTYTISWTITLVDMDGDDTGDPTAKEVVVRVDEMPARSLSMFLADPQNMVKKL